MLGSWVRAPCGSPSKKRNGHYDYSSFCISFIIPLRFHSSPFSFWSSYHCVFILPLFRSDHHTIAFSFFLFFVSIIGRFHINRSSFCIQFILLLHFNSFLFSFCLSHDSLQKWHATTVRKDDWTTDKRADDGVKVLLVISES